jgi:PKD repeat protein
MALARHLQTRLSVALALVALAVVAVAVARPAAARAAEETYGELEHFGSAGIGQGQFKITPGTNAFGVDQTDNDVYVGDEPKKKEYRVQKFTASGTYLGATPRFLPPNHAGIEGVAIDPVLKRIYVLVLEQRSVTLGKDSSGAAAGTLYAFSSEPSGEELAPASGTAQGVLTGPAVLEPQSDEPGKALLLPSGIAVDPTTHDVIVMGQIDEATGASPEDRVALQRVHSDGTLGARYVDTTNFFGGGAEINANSPVVTPTGEVYAVNHSNELAQVPSDFTSMAAPTTFVQFQTIGDHGEEAVVGLNGATKDGGGLSVAPKGGIGPSEDAIYAKGEVLIHTGQSAASYTGMLAFDATSGSEIGWTGGQSTQLGESCAINFGGETYASLAAGSEHMIFMFDPGKPVPLRQPRVIEFGPGGHGCPAAQASEPAATVAGNPFVAGETISPGTPVTFSSTMTQANALSVEWNFGDGQTKTVSEDEYQQTEVTHSFVRGGELTVTETIHTDDLATPTIVKETKISVSNVSAPPTAVLEGPLELTLGAAGHEQLVYLPGGGFALEGGGGGNGQALATFDGSASFDPNPPGSNQIVSYHWAFGDGSSETTKTPTATHAYEQAGTYKVELTVTDALGLTSEASALSVKINPPVPPPVVEQNHPATQGLVVTPSPGVASTTKPTPVPVVELAARSLRASSSGTVRLVVTCPAGETSCAGAVTLRTLHAVAVGASGGHGRRKKLKAAVITLASGRFMVAGGQQASVALHLSASARQLLEREHQLQARAAIVAHDPAGVVHTTQVAVTLSSSKTRR